MLGSAMVCRLCFRAALFLTIAVTASVLLAQPGGPAAGSGAKKADPKSLEALLKQGRDALAAGEYKAARDAFNDASIIDSRNVEALHGLGVAYMHLNDFSHAREPMEKALTANPAPSRALVLNMGVCQIGNKNPMRAAKIIMDYLTAHSKELDEPMLNAMGTALTVADDQAKKGRMFQDCVNYFVTYNQKLEKVKPGLKRWGVQWMKADDVDQRNAANAASGKQLAALDRDMGALETKITQQSRELETTKDLARRGFRSDYDVSQGVLALKVLTDSLDEKQKDYDEIVAKMQHPYFPKAMTLVAMDDLTPPAVAANVQIVAATPDVAPAAVAPPRRAVPRPKEVAGASGTGATGTGTGTLKETKPNPNPGNTAGSIDTKMPEEAPISVAAVEPVHRKVRINTYTAAFPVGADLVLTASGPLSGASEYDVQSADGTSMKAQLVRTDESIGLALLRVEGQKLVALPLAAAFNGGSLQCAAYPTVNIFNPAAESITGTSKPPGAGDWKVSLTRHPRLGGSPLVVQGKLVGVELATRDIDARDIPAATLEQIRKFLGPDAPSAQIGPEPCAAMLQLMATRETSGE